MGIQTLYDSQSRPPSQLWDLFVQRYDGDLSFPVQNERPHVIGNFVTTIDGVASFAISGKSGGDVISGFNADDQFIMGLLRTCADAVLVGSGTLHGDSGHVRTPEHVYPPLREEFRAFRRMMGKPVLPINVIVTASGIIDFEEPTFHVPDLLSIIITTPQGEEKLESMRNGKELGSMHVRSIAGEIMPSPEKIIALLYREYGVTLLLHEGGPTLFGEFLGRSLVDELFLTIAPQVAGRSLTSLRPSLAGGMTFLPQTAPWLKLVSLKRADSHLFVRYACNPH